MKKDSLGDRMKRFENVSRIKLIPRTYAIIRVDGRSFHTYSRNFEKPWDNGIVFCMKSMMKYLCENIQGTKFGYTQSDEVSLILTDFDNHETSAWFDSNIQKIVSISASMASTSFNFEMDGDISITLKNLAIFDSRVFNIPVKYEIINYLICRQQDMIRNSISGLAQTLYSQKQLYKKNQEQMKEMILLKGLNWDEFSSNFKRGSGCYKKDFKWIIDDNIPNFIDDRSYLNKIIPNISE